MSILRVVRESGLSESLGLQRAEGLQGAVLSRGDANHAPSLPLWAAAVRRRARVVAAPAAAVIAAAARGVTCGAIAAGPALLRLASAVLRASGWRGPREVAAARQAQILAFGARCTLFRACSDCSFRVRGGEGGGCGGGSIGSSSSGGSGGDNSSQGGSHMSICRISCSR